MHVVYHIGAHCTDEDRLLKCLLKNKGDLAQAGIAVPGPSRYRTLIREALLELRGKPAAPEMQRDILAEILDEDSADRLVLSNRSFLSAPTRVLAQHMLYPQAGEKTAWLANVLPDHSCEFHLALRNPATFVPALFKRTRETDFNSFIAGADPAALRWSDMVRRIRGACPQARLTVWCNEDTPLIWTEILAGLTGLSTQHPLQGSDDFLATLMSASGMTRMRRYLDTHPPKSDLQRRRILAAFLDKFALSDALEEELDVPGWTVALVDELSDRYDEDCYRIEAMEDVTFIAP
ncbi:hypothetical protein [Actibacterium ureilyticum]|uniref:hypothetical protein n=1 Tax=Actibacterium ureilyticum TaxID=1590614 RepID=UPI000BAADE7C|nr:hypothetical protein [Actibacterium ureilyticum]